MSIRSLFPDTRPSLNLDFANTRALDPRVTFARASTATYYDGKTTHKAEENLFAYSEDFSVGNWDQTGGIVSNTSATNPSGGSTSGLWTADGTLTYYRLRRSFSATSGVTYAGSVFLKRNGTSNRYVMIYLNWSSTGVWVDLDTSSIIDNYDGYPSSYSITDVGNGWRRVNVVDIATVSGDRFLEIFPQNSKTNSLNDTSVGDSVLTWGWQLEQRSSATAYTPTTSSPITRYAPTLLTAPINSPRFDHDPTTGESLGLLIEEQRTNLLLRSEEFDNVYWTKQDATITTNALIAPDGTLSADALIENTANVSHYIIRYFNQTTGYITLSVYAKSTNRNLHIGMWDGSAGGDSFVDLSNGSVISSSTGTTVVTNVGNGWYRISYTRNVASATGSPYFQLEPAIGTNRTYAGDGFSGIYLWGAQLEVGSFPTSYIPTSGSQATRLADNASMTGTNFSSWFNPTEGTFIAECDRGNDGTEGAGICAARGPAAPTQYSNMIQFGEFYDNSGYVGRIYTDTVGQVGISAVHTTGQGIYNKYAFAYKTDDAGGAVNGSDRGTDTSVTLPGTLDRLYFGRYDDDPSSNNLDGHIKYLKYFPTRIPNSQLQSLTTP